jgi:hypothetical protein
MANRESPSAGSSATAVVVDALPKGAGYPNVAKPNTVEDQTTQASPQRL